MADASQLTASEAVERFRQQELNTHAAQCLWVVTGMETALQLLLESKMPNLSKRLRSRLFTGYGPLASFSAKIDVAFATAIISNDLRKTLHGLRDVRNAFAHPQGEDITSFESPNIIALLQKIDGYKKDTDPFLFFLQKASLTARRLLVMLRERDKIEANRNALSEFGLLHGLKNK